MASFTTADNVTLDTTPHPTLLFPSEPVHPKAPPTQPAPSEVYLLSYLRNRTPPLLRPCRQAYTLPDYILLPHLIKLYSTLTPQQKLCLHLLYPASATAHLVTDTERTSFVRVLIAARRKVSGEIVDTSADGDDRSRAESAIRFLMTCHTMAAIDRELVNSVLGEGGVRAAVEAGERVAGDTLLENGLTELEMIRGMGGVLHQVLVGAEVEDRGGYVRIDRRESGGHRAGEKIGKRAGTGVEEIGEGVDVDATLRRLAISEAQERAREEGSSETWDLIDGIEGGVYDDEVDDAVLEGETGLSALLANEAGNEEVTEEPAERHPRVRSSLNAGAGAASGRGRGRGRGRGQGRGQGQGQGQGRGRERGRGRGGRGRGARKNASVKKQNAGMGMR